MTLHVTSEQSNLGTGFRQGLRIAIPFFWAGLLVAISFLEASLKFRAPGITLTLGLGIGQLVFTALNRLEWVLAICLIGSLLPDSEQPQSFLGPFMRHGLLISLLLWQTFGLLPMLSHRIELYQQNRMPGPSFVHWYYILAEVTKLILLLWLGFRALSKPVYYSQPQSTKNLINKSLTEIQL